MRRLVSNLAAVGLTLGIAGCGGGGMQTGMTQDPHVKLPEPPAAEKPGERHRSDAGLKPPAAEGPKSAGKR